MKKRNSALLIISALTALTLAACGEPTPSPSSAGGVSATASTKLPSSDSLSSGEVAGSSSSPISVSSSSSSSSSQEEVNWAGKSFLGQYHGGFTTLIINEDMSTSWDTDSTHFPAELEVLAGGIFHISSASSVDSEDKVDIYTDGTMAYVIHDAVEKDAFIVDKGAEYQAANGLAKKADGSMILGSIEVGSKTKFFRYLNGTYEFNVAVELTYGQSLEAQGAIFNVGSGSSKTTYRVVTAGNSALGTYAIIEDYAVVVTTYAGEAGDLVIGRNNGNIAYVILDGQPVDPALVVESEGAITIKGGERTLDDADPSNMVWVYSAVKYTLNDAAHTYVSEDATSREEVFHALDMNVNQYTQTVGDDGCLWATFTPSIGGFFNVSVASGTGENDPNDYYSTYDYIAIYRYDAAAYGRPYTYAEEYAYWDDGYYYSSEAEIENFEVEPGMTYIIKAGNNDDIDNVLGDDGSACAGMDITIAYSYTAFDVVRYTGDHGDLVLESYNGNLRNVTLNGQKITNVTKTGDVLTATAAVVDFSTDPNDPKRITTTITITIDAGSGTYSYESDSSSASVFHVLTEADSGTTYSTTVGADGNLWAIFNATSSGYLSVHETACTGSDGYLAFYRTSAPSFTDNSYSSNNSVIHSDSMSGTLEKIDNFLVNAGESIIIKAGAYADRVRDIGDTGSQFAGNIEAISITFSAMLTQTFNDENGANPLVLSTENGEYRTATINGEPIERGELVDNGDGTLTLSSRGAGTVDQSNPLDPIVSSTDTVYTIDVEAGTYSSASSTVSRHMIHEITSTPTTVSDIVAGDGNLWVKFTPDTDGYLTVEEMASTDTDGYLAIYESTAASFVPGNALKTADSGAALAGGGKISKLKIDANKTYIIKAGDWDDRSNLIGSTASAFEGKMESIKVEFDAFVTKTYSGDNGDLAITTAGDEITSVTLGGAALSNYKFDEDGNLVIVDAGTVDNSDPLNPTRTSSDTVYDLDDVANAYTVATETTAKNIFHEVTSSSVVTDIVGADGNLWIKFTAPSDGEISINELTCCAADGYMAVYLSTAAAFTDNYSHSNVLAYSDGLSGNLEHIDDLRVTAGLTYIIKCGGFYDRDKTVTTTGSSNVGKTESVNFVFNAYDAQVYTNEDGAPLTVTKKGDELLSVKVGNETIEGAVLDGETVIEDLGIIIGDDGQAIAAKNYYDLDDETHTYVIRKTGTALAESDDYVVAQSSPYGFTHDEGAGTYTSSNAGQHSTSAIMTITVNGDGALKFHYDVESEGSYNIYDYLTITVNGVVVEGCTKLGGTAGMSGDIVINVSAGDVVKFEYKKDSSNSYGRDNAIISDLHFLVVASND